MSLKNKPQLHIDWIDPHAKEIIQALQKAGHPAYLVGGCVRDLLAGINPKDYDIATSALPSDVRKKVRNAYIIGRRFKLVLAKRGDQQYEIATFRREASSEELQAEDQVFGDNFFGSLEDDAFRRDFTINSLFYNPLKEELIDHCKGLQDIQAGIVRMIGDPTTRIKEDSIRILRAVRLAHKLGFRIEENLRKAIADSKEELIKSALPRRREEWLKILRLEDSFLCFQDLYDLGVMNTVLPGLVPVFENEESKKLFHFYLKRIRHSYIDSNSPIELFSAFSLAILNSLNPEQLVEPELLSSSQFEKLAKDELGIFKGEVVAAQKAIEYFNAMKNPEAHRRKGDRRKASFLQSENVQLAFKMLEFTHELGAEELLYWKNQFSIK